MPEEIDLFCDILKRTNSDDVLLKAAENSYESEIKNVEEKAVDIAEGVLKKLKPIKKNEKHTTPTLIDEKVEDNVRKTTPDATSTAMRPNFPVVEKTSKFFKDLKYDISLDGVEATRNLNNNFSVSTNLDVFDKMVGANIEKKYNDYAKFKAGIEYEPFHNSGKLKAEYSTRMSNLYGNVYLNKDNPGVNAGYNKKINKNTSLSTNVSVFKEDAAFAATYNRVLKDKSELSLGAYGSTKYKEIGVTARIGF